MILDLLTPPDFWGSIFQIYSKYSLPPSFSQLYPTASVVPGGHTFLLPPPKSGVSLTYLHIRQ